MDRLLFLHIGTHKTGTSSIQRYLSERHDELLAHGVLYPINGRPDMAPHGHHRLAWAVSPTLQAQWGGTHAPCWPDVLAEIEARTPAATILSAEGFSALTQDEVARVRAYTQGYQVKVIVYLRNQLAYLVSLYKQNIKGGKDAGAFRTFIANNLARCNYPALLGNWAASFGKEHLLIRLYDREKKTPGLKHDFMHLLGVAPEESNALGGHGARNVNVSPGDDAIQVIRFLNTLEGKTFGSRAGVLHKLRRSLVRENKNFVGETLMTLSKPFLNNTLYTAEDVAWLRAETAAWNEALFHTYLDEAARPYFDF